MSRIEEVCRELNNWFDTERMFGEFEISNRALKDVDFLQYGQYYRIIGSVFNDGVWQYPGWLRDGVLVDEERKLILTEDGKAILTSTPIEVMTDEKFKGAIWAMAVPPAVIALCNEIDAYEEKYGDITKSPFQSESFGGYSYSKLSGSSGGSGSGNGADWRSVFKSKLDKWRKIRAL